MIISIKWIEAVLDVWPDTPVDYFKNLAKYWKISKYHGYPGVITTRSDAVLMMTRHYLIFMPVKTFEYVKKTYEQMSRDARRQKDELYDRGENLELQQSQRQ